MFAGHSSCIDLDRVEVVREGSSRVEVHAFVEHNSDESYTDDWAAETVAIELEEPLRDRQLIGCVGDAIEWHGWRLEPDTDCAERRTRNEWYSMQNAP